MQYGPPKTERGKFDFNWAVNIKQITDGATKTIAMGESAPWPNWPLVNTSAKTPIWSRGGPSRTHNNQRVFGSTGASHVPIVESYGRVRVAF